jgi:DNA-directed RNA polymerase subunit RPC12/RpoP
MIFSDRYLVKNCQRCGRNVVFEKGKLEENKMKPDQEFYCPHCQAFIGRLVTDRSRKNIDISL